MEPPFAPRCSSGNGREGFTMTRTLACLLATALVITTVAPAQGSVARKGGFSYGTSRTAAVLRQSAGTHGFALGLSFGPPQNAGLGRRGALRAARASPTRHDRRAQVDYVDGRSSCAPSSDARCRAYAYAGPQVSFELRCRAGGTDCPHQPALTSYARDRWRRPARRRGPSRVEGRYSTAHRPKLSTVRARRATRPARRHSPGGRLVESLLHSRRRCRLSRYATSNSSSRAALGASASAAASALQRGPPPPRTSFSS